MPRRKRARPLGSTPQQARAADEDDAEHMFPRYEHRIDQDEQQFVYYNTLVPDETPKGIAAAFDIDVSEIIEANAPRMRGLHATSKLHQNTQLIFGACDSLLVCSSCRADEQPDDLILLCSGDCGRAYHCSCVEVDVCRVPEIDFYCRFCNPKTRVHQTAPTRFYSWAKVIDGRGSHSEGSGGEGSGRGGGGGGDGVQRWVMLPGDDNPRTAEPSLKASKPRATPNVPPSKAMKREDDSQQILPRQQPRSLPADAILARLAAAKPRDGGTAEGRALELPKAARQSSAPAVLQGYVPRPGPSGDAKPSVPDAPPQPQYAPPPLQPALAPPPPWPVLSTSAPAPAEMSFFNKVGQIRELLNIDPATPIPSAIKLANGMMGLPDAGTLPQQADEVLRRIFE